MAPGVKCLCISKSSWFLVCGFGEVRVHHRSMQQAWQQELNAESSWISWIARTKQKTGRNSAWVFKLSKPVYCNTLPPARPYLLHLHQRAGETSVECPRLWEHFSFKPPYPATVENLSTIVHAWTSSTGGMKIEVSWALLASWPGWNI